MTLTPEQQERLRKFVEYAPHWAVPDVCALITAHDALAAEHRALREALAATKAHISDAGRRPPMTRYLRAYYFSFEPTGNDDVDAILEAVAMAGKAYHHTDQWDEPRRDGPSYAEAIQQAAQALADKLATQEGGPR